MKDIRVVRAKVLLKIANVTPIRDFVPPAILILGEKMDIAEEVFFNNVQVTEFIALNNEKMIARIPPSQVGKRLDSLEVRTSVRLAQRDAQVTLGVDRPIRTIEGIDRLVQEFVLVFLTTPGSDIFNKKSGGGALAIIGKPVSGKDGAMADLSVAVERTRSQLIAAQAQNTKIPASERLLSCSLSSVKYDARTTTISATVDIQNSVGGTAVVSIG